MAVEQFMSTCSNPVQRPEHGSCRPVLGGWPGPPVLTQELGDKQRVPTTFRLGFYLIWASVRSGTSVVYCPEIPLGHGLFHSGLLFLLSLFRISVEIRHDFPWVLTRDGATYVIGAGLPDYQTRPTGRLLLQGTAMSS